MQTNQSRILCAIAMSLAFMALPTDAYAQGAPLQGFMNWFQTGWVPALSILGVMGIALLMMFGRLNGWIGLAAIGGIYILNQAQTIAPIFGS